MWTSGPPARLLSIPNPFTTIVRPIGEVKPRYESDLSFRVAGKVLARLRRCRSVRSDKATRWRRSTRRTFSNRLRSAEADVSSAEAELVEARGTEARKAKLLKDGWTPQATYDTALRNLRSAEARLHVCQGQSRPDPRPAPLHRAQGRIRRRDHRRRRRAGSERQRWPDGGEARPTGRQGRRLQHRRDRFHGSHPEQRAFGGHRLAAVQPGTEDRGHRTRDLSRRRLHDTHLYRQSNAQESAASAAVRHEHRRSLEGQLRSRGGPPPLSTLRKERLPRRLGVRSGLRQRRAKTSYRLPLRDRHRRHCSTGSPRETSSSLPASIRCGKVRKCVLPRPLQSRSTSK